MIRCRSVFALGVLVLVSACANARFDVPASVNDERVYAALFPYYAEYCAVSQIKKRPGLEPDTSGGVGGHAVLYLNGVCRDAGAGYPTIRMCDAAAGADHDGVGISINAHFRNANWIATPGRDFFFRGALGPNEPVTLSAYRKTQAKAQRLGILDGVEYHAEVFDQLPPGMARRDYMYEVSVATDYAIEMARHRYCARVPLRRDQMARAVDYLNGLNALYRDGRRAFEWNVFQDNCIHGLHNALAAAGVWEVWPTNRFVLVAALDFPTPKNEFVNLANRTNDLPLDRPELLYRDEAARRAVVEDGSLPAGAGSLALAVPAMTDNEVYDPDVRLIFYDEPLLGSYEGRFRRIFSERRYTDLRANLEHFQALYVKTRSLRSSALEVAQGEMSLSREGEFAAFQRHYDRFLARQLQSIGVSLLGLPKPPLVSR
jgi:hypothetical protein